MVFAVIGKTGAVRASWDWRRAFALIRATVEREGWESAEEVFAEQMRRLMRRA